MATPPPGPTPDQLLGSKIKILDASILQEDWTLIPERDLSTYLSKLFKAADINGDGLLQPEEYQELLNRSDFRFPKTLTQQALEQVQTSQGGAIECAVFVQRLKTMLVEARYSGRLYSPQPRCFEAGATQGRPSETYGALDKVIISSEEEAHQWNVKTTWRGSWAEEQAQSKAQSSTCHRARNAHDKKDFEMSRAAFGDANKLSKLKTTPTKQTEDQSESANTAGEQISHESRQCSVCKVVHAEGAHLGSQDTGASKPTDELSEEELRRLGSLMHELASAKSEIWDVCVPDETEFAISPEGRDPAATREALCELESTIEVVREHSSLRQARLELEAKLRCLEGQEQRIRGELTRYRTQGRGLSPTLALEALEGITPHKACRLDGEVSREEWQRMKQFEVARAEGIHQSIADCGARIQVLLPKLEQARLEYQATLLSHPMLLSGPLSLAPDQTMTDHIQAYVEHNQALQEELDAIIKDPAAELISRKVLGLKLEIASAEELIWVRDSEQLEVAVANADSFIPQQFPSTGGTDEQQLLMEVERATWLEGQILKAKSASAARIEELAALEASVVIVRRHFDLREEREALEKERQLMVRKEERKSRAVQKMQMKVERAAGGAINPVNDGAFTIIPTEEKQCYPRTGVTDQLWEAMVRLEECQLKRVKQWMAGHTSRMEAMEARRAELEGLCISEGKSILAQPKLQA